MRTEPWLTVEELTRIGFERSRVLMANEAHSGLLRCPRTRRVGVRMVRAAHACGVRRLAMEALPNEPGDPAPFTGPLPENADAGGYLGQPEMHDLIGAARDLGWTLWPYEIVIDFATLSAQEAISDEFTNRRELAQAQNLAALAGDGAPLLVWCGNGHAGKERSGDEWVPMGWHFPRLAGVEAFAVDQTVTVDWPEHGPIRPDIVTDVGAILAELGGTAGVLREDIPPEEGVGLNYDAYIASLDNAFV